MLTVDPSLATPPYEQIREQITASRSAGELSAGQRLPTVRHLAAELGLAPNTVARAYRELEASGIIETRGRNGSFITGTQESAEKVALAAAREYVTIVRRLRIGDEQSIALVRDALESF